MTVVSERRSFENLTGCTVRRVVRSKRSDNYRIERRVHGPSYSHLYALGVAFHFSDRQGAQGELMVHRDGTTWGPVGPRRHYNGDLG